MSNSSYETNSNSKEIRYSSSEEAYDSDDNFQDAASEENQKYNIPKVAQDSGWNLAEIELDDDDDDLAGYSPRERAQHDHSYHVLNDDMPFLFQYKMPYEGIGAYIDIIANKPSKPINDTHKRIREFYEHLTTWGTHGMYAKNIRETWLNTRLFGTSGICLLPTRLIFDLDFKSIPELTEEMTIEILRVVDRAIKQTCTRYKILEGASYMPDPVFPNQKMPQRSPILDIKYVLNENKRGCHVYTNLMIDEQRKIVYRFVYEMFIDRIRVAIQEKMPGLDASKIVDLPLSGTIRHILCGKFDATHRGVDQRSCYNTLLNLNTKKQEEIFSDKYSLFNNLMAYDPHYPFAMLRIDDKQLLLANQDISKYQQAYIDKQTTRFEIREKYDKVIIPPEECQSVINSIPDKVLSNYWTWKMTCRKVKGLAVRYPHMVEQIYGWFDARCTELPGYDAENNLNIFKWCKAMNPGSLTMYTVKYDNRIQPGSQGTKHDWPLIKEYLEQRLPADVFNEVHDTYLVRSGMGSGKTHIVLDWLAKKGYTFLYAGVRCLLNEAMLARFAKQAGLEVKLYSTLNKQNRRKYDADRYYDSKHLICQVDSLWRCYDRYGNIRAYDVLILDEVESIIRQMESSTIRGRGKGVMVRNYLVLRELIRLAKIVICLDGQLSQATLDLVKSCRSDDILYIRNNFVPEQAPCTEIQDLAVFKAMFDQAVVEQKKQVFLSNSKATVDAYNQVARDVAIKAGRQIRILSFTRDTNQHDRKIILPNIDEYLPNYNLLSYSPTLGCGVDIQYEMDVMFVHVKGISCVSETIIQMIGRVRNVKQIYIYFDVPYIKARPGDYSFNSRMRKLAGNNDSERYENNIAVVCSIWHRIQVRATKNDTRGTVLRYLREAGYQVSTLEKNANNSADNSLVQKEISQISVAIKQHEALEVIAAQDIPVERYEDIQHQIMDGQQDLNRDDMLSFKKASYQMQYQIQDLAHPDSKTLKPRLANELNVAWLEYLSNPQTKAGFNTLSKIDTCSKMGVDIGLADIVAMLEHKHESLIEIYDNDVGYACLKINDTLHTKYQIVAELLAVLNIVKMSRILDCIVLDSDMIDDMARVYFKRWIDIQAVFEIKYADCLASEAALLKSKQHSKLQRINKIFKSVLGLSLQKISRGSTKYQLQPYTSSIVLNDDTEHELILPDFKNTTDWIEKMRYYRQE